MTRYYKIVRSSPNPKSSDGFEHCSAVCLQSSLKYSKDYWTRPKIKYSRIFIFEELKSTIQFCQSCDIRNWPDTEHRFHIFECKIRGFTHIPNMALLDDNLADFWKFRYQPFWEIKEDQLPREFIPRSWFTEPPRGTVGAEEVLLIGEPLPVPDNQDFYTAYARGAFLKTAMKFFRYPPEFRTHDSHVQP